MVKVNGKQEAFDGMTVRAMLEALQCQTDRVAVERNEDIVPKAQYDAVILQDGDSIEVVSFVGGG